MLQQPRRLRSQERLGPSRSGSPHLPGHHRPLRRLPGAVARRFTPTSRCCNASPCRSPSAPCAIPASKSTTCASSVCSKSSCMAVLTSAAGRRLPVPSTSAPTLSRDAVGAEHSDRSQSRQHRNDHSLCYGGPPPQSRTRPVKWIIEHQPKSTGPLGPRAKRSAFRANDAYTPSSYSVETSFPV